MARLSGDFLMRVMKFLSFFVILSVSLLPIYPASGLSALDFSVILEDNTLSVSADNVPLQTILQKLAADGITVKIDPAINPLISANFHRRPLEQALESLLKSASYSLLWESETADPKNPELRLVEIQVFQTGQKENMQELPVQRIEVIKKDDKGRFYVKDEILLYIPPGTNIAALRKLIRSYNGMLLGNIGFPDLIKIVLPKNSDVSAIAREINQKLNLEIAQPNYAYPVSPPVQFAGEFTAADSNPGYNDPADNRVPVAILDSGMSEQESLAKFVFASLDVMTPDTPVTDTLGHGTQMAFIASGIVKPFGSVTDPESLTPIIPIRAFDDNGFTTDAKIAHAINFALANNAGVISLSWGSETRSAIMEKAMEYATARGLIIVAAAGNEPTGKPVYPAAYPSVIGVGALGPHGKTWEKSNFGGFVALYAPGIAYLPVGYGGEPGLYGGTSIATAFVANSIAVYLTENPAATPEDIRNYLHTRF